MATRTACTTRRTAARCCPPSGCGRIKTMGKTKLKNESHESTLETALDFTGADLEANREGKLTARQYDRLLTQRNEKRRTALTVLGLVVFVIVFCGFVALTSGAKPFNLGDAFFPLVIFVPLFVLILVAAANRWRKL